MRALHMRAPLLLLLAGLPCIRYAECLLGGVSQDSASGSSDVSSCEPWWSSVEQCSVQCLQLQQKSRLHDVTYSKELVSVGGALLVVGIFACLLVSVAVNVWQMQQRAADKAHFRVEKQGWQACCRGIKAEAADLGSRAMVFLMQKQAMVKQMMLISGELQESKSVTQQLQQQAQVAASTPAVAKSNTECQTSDDLDDALAPTSPKLAGEAASPCGEAPQLQGEASMPTLQELVGAAADSEDAARCMSDQCGAGTAAAAASTAAASGAKRSSPSKLQLQDVPVHDLVQVVTHARGSPLAVIADVLNHHLAEQGVEGRLEVQQSKAAAAASSSSNGMFSTPLSEPAGRHEDKVALGVQQQGTSPHSVLSERSSDRRSSEFVTHHQLSIAMLTSNMERVKEENSLLKSENKVMQQQLQQQSSAVTPVMLPSSAYINRTRGSAGTPSPFHRAVAGQPGFSMHFSPTGNASAQLSAPGSSSMLDASSAAASSSCFIGLPVPGQQAPGSVGSTRHSPQGRASATPCTAPGSAASTASRRAVEPLPMQPLEPAGSPAGKPSPVLQQQAQGPAAAKALAEAINKARDKNLQVCRAAASRRKEAEAKKATTPART